MIFHFFIVIGIDRYLFIYYPSNKHGRTGRIPAARLYKAGRSP